MANLLLTVVVVIVAVVGAELVRLACRRQLSATAEAARGRLVARTVAAPADPVSPAPIADAILPRAAESEAA